MFFVFFNTEVGRILEVQHLFFVTPSKINKEKKKFLFDLITYIYFLTKLNHVHFLTNVCVEGVGQATVSVKVSKFLHLFL